MARASLLDTAVTGAVWGIGSRLPHWVRRVVCTLGPWLVNLRPPASVRQWEANAATAVGRPATGTERRLLVGSWLRNNLMSLSLASWSDEDVLSRVVISDVDVAKLRQSLAGPGLVLAIPHMGSWDFAGAWCARIGIEVLSVAEKLPRGLYERFRDARAGMGMDIVPVGQPDLMRCLVDGVRSGEAVCLLSDRDLSGRGIPVRWPGVHEPVHVPAGPAILSRITGCDLRVASTVFRGDTVEIRIGDVVPRDTTTAMMTEVVEQFAAAVRRDPTSWLMLQPFFGRT